MLLSFCYHMKPLTGVVFEPDYYYKLLKLSSGFITNTVQPINHSEQRHRLLHNVLPTKRILAVIHINKSVRNTCAHTLFE